jgi:large subunit ribosomal protein L23
MELTRVILGPVVTEKSELLKQERTYAIKVSPAATKVDVKNALRKHFDVEVSSVRVLRVGSKTRSIGPRSITKRKPFKKVFVTLSKGSKGLDLAQFKTA